MADLTVATAIISNKMLPEYRGREGDAGVGRRIAECHSYDEAKDIRDKAAALETYARQARKTAAMLPGAGNRLTVRRARIGPRRTTQERSGKGPVDVDTSRFRRLRVASILRCGCRARSADPRKRAATVAVCAPQPGGNCPTRLVVHEAGGWRGTNLGQRRRKLPPNPDNTPLIHWNRLDSATTNSPAPRLKIRR